MEVFRSVYDLAHQVIFKRNWLVCNKYFWSSMNEEVDSWDREFIACQKCKSFCVNAWKEVHYRPFMRFASLKVSIVLRRQYL